MASLEEARFYLPRDAQVEVGSGNPNANDIPISKRDNKTMHHVPPGNDHDSRWFSGEIPTATILRMKNVLNLEYGCVYSLESHGGVKVVTYELTTRVIPNCTCPNFVSMLTSLKERGKFIFASTYISFIELGYFVITRQMIS
jgi:hypothetical protein